MEGDGKAEGCFIGFGSDQKWKTAALPEAAVAASLGSKQLQTDQKSESRHLQNSKGKQIKSRYKYK